MPLRRGTAQLGVHRARRTRSRQSARAVGAGCRRSSGMGPRPALGGRHGRVVGGVLDHVRMTHRTQDTAPAGPETGIAWLAGGPAREGGLRGGPAIVHRESGEYTADEVEHLELFEFEEDVQLRYATHAGLSFVVMYGARGRGNSRSGSRLGGWRARLPGEIRGGQWQARATVLRWHGCGPRSRRRWRAVAGHRAAWGDSRIPGPVREPFPRILRDLLMCSRLVEETG